MLSEGIRTNEGIVWACEHATTPRASELFERDVYGEIVVAEFDLLGGYAFSIDGRPVIDKDEYDQLVREFERVHDPRILIGWHKGAYEVSLPADAHGVYFVFAGVLNFSDPDVGSNAGIVANNSTVMVSAPLALLDATASRVLVEYGGRVDDLNVSGSWLSVSECAGVWHARIDEGIAYNFGVIERVELYGSTLRNYGRMQKAQLYYDSFLIMSDGATVEDAEALDGEIFYR